MKDCALWETGIALDTHMHSAVLTAFCRKGKLATPDGTPPLYFSFLCLYLIMTYAANCGRRRTIAAVRWEDKQNKDTSSAKDIARFVFCL